ncbi:unnamed protein product [Effrenium voratum]|nr:unnamed protein product [Effrenium voratum]
MGSWCFWKGAVTFLTPASWSTPAVEGAVVSQRQSLAVCGLAGASEKALLFGGNTSRRVAGDWQTSKTLCLVDLPADAGTVNFAQLERPGQPWPAARWGATLTQTAAGAVLWGGWGRDGRTDQPWILRLREACPEWHELQDGNGPATAAFHTATGLPDGKRMAVVGGLGDGSSHDGVWVCDSSREKWEKLCDGGPAPAGHVAAVDYDAHRLVLCFGVRRQAPWFNGDSFLGTTSVLDLRMSRWDAAPFPVDLGEMPVSRRNPAGASLGRRLVVSGGYSDEDFASLDDTWSLDMQSGVWQELPAAGPRLEGHKAVCSGLDIFTFGGHKLVGRFEGPQVSVHRLAIGKGSAGSSSDSDGSGSESSAVTE